MAASRAPSQKRSTDPLVPLHLIRNRDLLVGSAVTFGYMASFGTLLYFMTMYFQAIRGHSALETGIAFLVPMVAIAIGAQTAGRVATRFGFKATLIVSLVVGGLGTALLAGTLSTSTGYAALVPGLVVLGLGQGRATRSCSARRRTAWSRGTRVSGPGSSRPPSRSAERWVLP